MHVHLKHLPRGNWNLAMLHLPPSRSYQSRYCELLQVVRLDKAQQAHLPPKCEQNLRILPPTRYRRSQDGLLSLDDREKEAILSYYFLVTNSKEQMHPWRHNVF